MLVERGDGGPLFLAREVRIVRGLPPCDPPQRVVVEQSEGAAPDQARDARRRKGEAGAAAFYIEPEDAKTALDELRRDPLASGGAEGLRLSVTPLGAAFEACGGWAGGGAEAAGTGAAAPPVLRGSRSVVEATAPKLREQVQGQGLEVGAWQVPIFCCGEMQTSSSTPFFFTHADLVEFWVVAGGQREEVPQQVALMDLRVLVAQMQTDAFPWSTAKLICSRQAAELAGAVHKEAQQ